VLADAFGDYAWTRWTVDPNRQHERIEALQRLAMKHFVLPYGEVWVACDEHGEILSVAMWLLPTSTIPAGVLAEAAVRQAELEGTRHAASRAAEAAVAALRPATRHYYLGTVGTRRDQQGHGHATALLQPVLERAARGGDAVYLETSDTRNRDLYTRLGFTVVDEIDVTGGGPHVWAMQKDP
jgi:ribosomal protein S18 acetylase RimI-like enzyme